MLAAICGGKTSRISFVNSWCHALESSWELGIVTIDRTDGVHVFRCRLNRSGNDVSLRLNPGVVPEGMLLIRGDCEDERVTLHSNGILIEQIHTDV